MAHPRTTSSQIAQYVDDDNIAVANVLFALLEPFEEPEEITVRAHQLVDPGKGKMLQFAAVPFDALVTDSSESRTSAAVFNLKAGERPLPISAVLDLLHAKDSPTDLVKETSYVMHGRAPDGVNRRIQVVNSKNGDCETTGCHGAAMALGSANWCAGGECLQIPAGVGEVQGLMGLCSTSIIICSFGLAPVSVEASLGTRPSLYNLPMGLLTTIHIPLSRNVGIGVDTVLSVSLPQSQHRAVVICYELAPHEPRLACRATPETSRIIREVQAAQTEADAWNSLGGHESPSDAAGGAHKKRKIQLERHTQ